LHKFDFFSMWTKKRRPLPVAKSIKRAAIVIITVARG
jgi:hypothetical protein